MEVVSLSAYALVTLDHEKVDVDLVDIVLTGVLAAAGVPFCRL